MEEELQRDDRSGETQGAVDGRPREVSLTAAASDPPSPTRTTSESAARGRRGGAEISANARGRSRTLSGPRRRPEPPVPLTKEEFAAAIARLTAEESFSCMQRLATGTEEVRAGALLKLRSLVPADMRAHVTATTAAVPAVTPATEPATPSPACSLAEPDKPSEVEQTSRKRPAAAVEDTPSPQASSGRARRKKRARRRTTTSPRQPDGEGFIAPPRRHTARARAFELVTPEAVQAANRFAGLPEVAETDGDGTQPTTATKPPRRPPHISIQFPGSYTELKGKLYAVAKPRKMIAGNDTYKSELSSLGVSHCDAIFVTDIVLREKLLSQ
ncbi:uncharacterized protein LOC126285044 [Schistocerca gregaria]|uniref:uncharacterized protein LOC126285044 n=1 Tax=Schistocerca gregaria TaxID=7010 RepID=UPI00211EC6F5|nr:uncharacterized protein LOC126285044 [Schistocerca gregaria]